MKQEGNRVSGIGITVAGTAGASAKTNYATVLVGIENKPGAP